MEEQVSQALSRVQSIMSDVKLSIKSVPSQKFLPIISDILSEITEVVACVQEDDVMSVDEFDDDLWWDSSPEYVHYSDGGESMVSTILFSSSDELGGFRGITPLKRRVDPETSSPCVASQVDVNTQAPDKLGSDDDVGSLTSLSSDDKTKDFINRILSSISKSAPGDIFSRRKSDRRRERMLRSQVHPELFTIWQNSSQMFAPYTVRCSSPTLLHPTINLREINVHFLGNIPKPRKFPISGCSQDPEHYSTWFTSDPNSRHGSPFGPIGFAYGYQTNNGVVAVPDKPVHGYVWDHDNDSWVLFSDASIKDPGRGRSHSRNQRG